MSILGNKSKAAAIHSVGAAKSASVKAKNKAAVKAGGVPGTGKGKIGSASAVSQAAAKIRRNRLKK